MTYGDMRNVGPRQRRQAREEFWGAATRSPADDLLNVRLRQLLTEGLGDCIGVGEQFECAELCLAAGLNEAARTLYQLAAVRQGFSALMVDARQPVAARIGAGPEPRSEPIRCATTVELAALELESLQSAATPRFPRDHPRNEPLASLPRSHLLTGAFERAACEPAPGDLTETIDQLYGMLTAPGEPEPDVAEALASRLSQANTGQRVLDYAGLANAALDDLAAAVNFVALQYFVRSHAELVFPPSGSLDLLRRTARLDVGGLGAYLSNVGQIVRNSLDVFELASRVRSAEPGLAAENPELQAWVVLLSRGLHDGLLYELIDDLGDLDARPALLAIFERFARLPESRIEPGLLWRLRDAALDNRDYAFAARVQRLVIELRPGEPLEQRILGDIQASGGQFASAEQTFLHCLALNPDYAEAHERLRALQARRFDAFIIRGGFGSPSHRKYRRLRRGQAIAAENRVSP